MAVDRVYVFDACAVVALLDNEPGAMLVEELLESQNQRCIIHVINACEVYYHLWRLAGESRAGQLEAILNGYGFVLSDLLSSELWYAAGKLKAQWRRVSLADCFCLALAIHEKGTLVTSDHHELDRIAQAGLCPIQFIR